MFSCLQLITVGIVLNCNNIYRAPSRQNLPFMIGAISTTIAAVGMLLLPTEHNLLAQLLYVSTVFMCSYQTFLLIMLPI
jgi:hypothetical protein